MTSKNGNGPSGYPKLRRVSPPPTSPVARALEHCSHGVTVWAGSSWAFTAAVLVIIAWLVTGPLFHFSDTWQLVINTGTTVVTFLMVFLIQRTQNKESLAVQLKLNELVAAIKGASNRLIDIENLDEEELHVLRAHYRLLAEKAKQEGSLLESHSVDEAEARHREKFRATTTATSKTAT
ncbi:MAG TPA: low affinity iron permease family protein [Polyangia bacterium]|jgi:low affinity Fe/Cu permease|nr:low affinity iron permease family protein [Polyangia bacterium]